MKHVSWIVAVVIGFVVGFTLRGSVDFGGRAPARSAAVQPGQPRPAGAVEDARAVYRVPVDDTPVKGPADALVTIVESSDFECPFCKRVVPTLKQLEEAFPGKLRFSFRQNPLPFHQRAMPAAMATEEARAQGGDAKFWAMHDALFAAGSLDDAAIEQAARTVGLDVEKVKEAVATQKHRSRVERDQRLVSALGARGTPAFFINGRKLSGAQPFEAFRAVVEEELRKAEAMVKAGTPASQVYARIIEKGASAPVMTGGPAAPAAAAPAAPPAAPPAVYRKVPVRADDPARGPKDAKLTVVLFSDFECPFCARVEPTLKQLEEAFPGQVRVVWKHQPIPSLHPNAMAAALATEAAREQGKFWELHAKLFENQRALGAEALPGYARAAGLDVARFEKALAAKRGEARIVEDQRLGNSVGASGTPTMFFNCRQVVGAQPLDRMKTVAADELAKADRLLAGKAPDAGFYDKACEANVAAAPAAAAAPAPGVEAVPAALQAADVPVRPDDPIRGNPRAPVTLVLFSDFQCPFCARVGPTLDQVRQQYGDQVRIVWKHQPLGFHPNALPAAEAAEAAREQGKFWPMHDRLFAAQRELSAETYERIAREIGLDVEKFRRATASGRFRARIQEDQQLASRIGAGGTPTMFVNGERIVGAVPFEQVKAVIDRKLAAR